MRSSPSEGDFLDLRGFDRRYLKFHNYRKNIDFLFCRMAERTRIGLRDVRALGPNQEVRDTVVPGFGARRQTGDSVTFVLLNRTIEERQRRHSIGWLGQPWTPDSARNEAKRLLGEVVQGGDPAGDKRAKRHAVTVNDLYDLYWAEGESGRLITRRRTPKRASTLERDKGRIDRHIRPLLGAMTVASVTSRDVEKFLHEIAAGKTAARTPTGKKRDLSNARGGRGVASRTVGCWAESSLTRSGRGSAWKTRCAASCVRRTASVTDA